MEKSGGLSKFSNIQFSIFNYRYYIVLYIPRTILPDITETLYYFLKKYLRKGKTIIPTESLLYLD